MSADIPTGRRRLEIRERRKGRARTTAREVPPAIQWHEGMLLAPQHFQQLALRQETLLHYHASSIAPFHWGVRHIEIDSVLLVDGVFRIVELEAVMPDGLIVSHSAGEGPDLAVELTPHIEEMHDHPVTVFLAVAARGRGLELNDRYGSEQSNAVPDENTGEGDLPMQILRPKLHLIVGDDPPPKYIGFPIAELTYANETFSKTRFEPPWLRVAPGTVLYELCNDLATRLREKAAFLAEQVRVPSSSATAPQLLDTKMMVHGLVGELPAFEAVLRTGVSHPFAVYQSLCSVVGHVAAVGRSLVPPVLEAYDHNHLYATFDQIRLAIARMLAEGVNEKYTAFPFAQEGDEFRLQFDPDWANRPIFLGVRAPSGTSEQEISAWVSAAVIGARSRISSLRDRRIPGVRRRRVESEASIVPPRGVTLYALSPDPDTIVGGEDLVILNPADEGKMRPDWIVLFVRNRT